MASGGVWFWAWISHDESLVDDTTTMGKSHLVVRYECSAGCKVVIWRLDERRSMVDFLMTLSRII